MRGKIKFYNVAKRFGFIVPDDGTGDLYFAESSLPRSRQYDPVEGDVVEFEARATDRENRLACNIVLDIGDTPPVKVNGSAQVHS